MNDLFSTMLSPKDVYTGLSISEGRQQPHEVMALIGFSGVMRGTEALALPSKTCSAMVSRLPGTTVPQEEESVSDANAEIVNIGAGSTKARLSSKVKPTLELSLPVVFQGEDFDAYSPSKAVGVEIPFDSGLGLFTTRLSFKVDVQGTA